MEGSYFNYKIRQFLVESYSGENVFDMTQCVASVQYFEDLFSPAVFVRLLLVNTDGLLTTFSKGKDGKSQKQKYGLRGGERISLKIEQEATKDLIFLDETTSPYYIYKISGSTTQSTKEVVTIDLAPTEVFKNETIRVSGKYKNQSIDKSVTEILNTVLKTSKKKFIEKTQNSYAFYGNTKKPFTVLTWLAPKSIPAIAKSSPVKGTAGFLFYENKRGYHFRSLDNLLKGLDPNSTEAKAAQRYSYSEVVNSAANISQNKKILTIPVFEKNVNVFENMRIGMYSSANVFFDLNTKTSETYEYKLSESYESMKHTSSKNEKPEIPLNLQDNPSRLMVKLIDSIVADPKVNSDPLKKEDNRIKYQSQSIARYNLAFSQVLNITVPLNLTLSVGDVVNLDFGNITKDNSNKGLRDDIKSGLYLIKELCHEMSQNQGFTGLKVVRDSYGV
jgi:hypothetical protein